MLNVKVSGSLVYDCLSRRVLFTRHGNWTNFQPGFP